MRKKSRGRKLQRVANEKVVYVDYIDDRCKLKKGSAGALCFDAVARLSEPLVIKANTIVKVPIGIRFDLNLINRGALICSRSGISTNDGVMVINGIGIIDSDYRGECCVSLYNTGVYGDFVVEPYSRVTQVMFVRADDVSLVTVSELSDTDRGAGGFGSSGTKIIESKIV